MLWLTSFSHPICIVLCILGGIPSKDQGVEVIFVRKIHNLYPINLIHPRQKLRVNNTITVNNSSLPNSIPKLSSHFAASGKCWKVWAGPVNGPIAGPTFAMAVAALEKAVRKSRPRKPSPNARRLKAKNHMKKKLNTDVITSSDIGRRL